MRIKSLAMSLAAAALSLLMVMPAASAQDKVVVTGQVLDETGLPLIGIAVLEKGTNNGVVTDLDGAYALTLPEGAVIEFSSIGYVTLEETAHAGVINVVLKEDNLMLEETVVIGYGVQKKRDVTGAISSIKSNDLKNSPNTSIASSLQGKVSGVQVVNSSSAPGASPSIRVRGYSSNGASDPLYIVDGLKVSDISYLDPNSIESMEVLKDAASAAIYGAEAGNGVILITTKNGKDGTSLISFDAQWTISSLAKKMELMHAAQYAQYYTEAEGDGFTALYDLYNIKGTDTDWQDVMYGKGLVQKYNLSAQAGNDKGSFFVNLGYVDNDGMITLDKDFYKRVSGQVNASYKVRKWLEIGTSNTFAVVRSSTISESSQHGIMKDILGASPLTPVYYTEDNLLPRIQGLIDAGLHPMKAEDGTYYGYAWHGASNPLAGLDVHDLLNKSFTINGMTYANIMPVKGLVFTSRLGYMFGSLNTYDYNPYRINAFFDNADTDPQLISRQFGTLYYQWENFANYNLSTSFGDWGALLGMSYSDYEQQFAGGQTNSLSSYADNFKYLNYSTMDADDYLTGSTTQRRQIAYYGRLSWAWGNRYNAQFNFRADSYDAAYLDLDHNWGFFPSVSVGWTFSNEEFMKGLKGGFFDYGKLRASWGVNGSISNLGGYMYASTLQTGINGYSNMTYYLDGKMYQATYPSSKLANPNLRWERSKQLDLGLDLRFLKGRLVATLDYYDKLTDGLLVQSVAPLTTGAGSVYENLGKVSNRGLEVELEWKDQIGDFSYGVKGNVATVKNVVKEYRGKDVRLSGMGLSTFEEGYPIWYLRGYKYLGADKLTGEALYEDANGDGEITEADRTDLGNGIPKLTYGLTFTAAWKGFDVMVYGAGNYGNKLYYGLDSKNKQAFFYNGRWTPTHIHAEYPSALYQVNDSRFRNSDAFVYDASFFRIKQIQLGYSLPASLLSKANIFSVRLYASMENWFTFTRYPGNDPETNGGATGGMAIDYGNYPMPKSLSFGVNVTF